ncbi:hypothetical protein [Neorhizobium sp. LjRoot104]|uniref:hypothetical protein n=1 Tax=Neorhizobium sp. LjRoot104 TaxID=3342254 RepID=UPI003ECD3EA0
MYTLEFNKKLMIRYFGAAPAAGLHAKLPLSRAFFELPKKRHFPFAWAETGDIETRAPEGLSARVFDAV